MRRINTRKRNKFNIKVLNTKTIKIISILVILLILLFFVYFYFIRNIFIKRNFEKEYTSISSLNEETIFSLNKILLFSSATANTRNLSNSVWNLDVSQFTDICVYINNISSNDEQKNIIKELYLDNFSISKTEYGTPCLYRKNIKDFGICSYQENTIVSDRLDFNIVSMGTDINYLNNEIYNDLSTPISLGFYNKDIKTDFLYSNSLIEYNGKILKDASIPKTSINCNISFNINIINNLDEKYLCTVNIDIPFESNNSSIYEDGYITKEITNLDNYKFLRVK